jgi:hypothetical protein
MLKGETMKLRKMNTNKASFSKKLPYSRHSDGAGAVTGESSGFSVCEVTKSRKILSSIDVSAILLP